MADTQSEDYKVLQAMRTEISGLVDSKNTLDLEIKKLEEDKVQAELEFSAVDSKLKDVSGEWSNKMRDLIDRENSVKERELTLTTERNLWDTKHKEEQDAINYLTQQAKDIDTITQQRSNESAKKEVVLKAEEQRLGTERAGLDKKIVDIVHKEAQIAGRETQIIEREVEVDQFNAKQLKREVAITEREAEVRQLEGEISKGSSEALAKVAKKEENLRQREGMMEDRERKLKQQKATMSLRITKREAEDVERMKDEVVEKTNKLYRERSEFELEVKQSNDILYKLREDANKARETLTSIEGKIADIERREKGVIDTEAGLVAKEKQLMFEIAKFKKRVKDAKMEEVINESG